MRVPSSKLPSPMKSLKNISGSSSRQSLSPLKIDHEATKALQETILSLLGKRPTLEGEDFVGVAYLLNFENKFINIFGQCSTTAISFQLN